MFGQRADVPERAVDAGERANQPKQPQDAEDSDRPCRRDDRDEVDPMPSQIRRPVARGREPARELGDEGDRQYELGEFETWRHRLEGRIVEGKPDRDVDDREQGHRELPRDVMPRDERVEPIPHRLSYSQPIPSWSRSRL